MDLCTAEPEREAGLSCWCCLWKSACVICVTGRARMFVWVRYPWVVCAGAYWEHMLSSGCLDLWAWGCSRLTVLCCQIRPIHLTRRSVPFSQDHSTNNCYSHFLCAGYLSKQDTELPWECNSCIVFCYMLWTSMYALTCKFTTECTPTKLLVVAEQDICFSFQQFIFPPFHLSLAYRPNDLCLPQP